MSVGREDMNDRTCIVTGEKKQADELLRFVQGPDGQLVVDIKQNLPGRGCWVTANRTYIERAVAKNAFARALKTKVLVPHDFVGTVEERLASTAIGAVAMARKAGNATSGAMQVDKAVRAGKALAVLHSTQAAPDGVRKIDQARRATVHLGGPETETFALFDAEQMGLAFGDGNVIHAAVLDGGAGHAALRRIKQLAKFRQEAQNDREAGKSGTLREKMERE